jgi:RNA polymerase sigma-70 factor (ECF subfamily)
MTLRTVQVSGLETYRDYLRLVAQVQLPVALHCKIDASDIVQDTLLRAHERRDQFDGKNDAQLAAWLRTILSHQLTDAMRRFHSEKRDIDLEISFMRTAEDSASKLQQLLESSTPGPHEHAMREEDLLKLSSALAELPDDQREAVESKHLHSLSLEEISRRLERTKPAVAGLLRRGMRRLREILAEPV